MEHHRHCLSQALYSLITLLFITASMLHAVSSASANPHDSNFSFAFIFFFLRTQNKLDLTEPARFPRSLWFLGFLLRFGLELTGFSLKTLKNIPGHSHLQDCLSSNISMASACLGTSYQVPATWTVHIPEAIREQNAVNSFHYII